MGFLLFFLILSLGKMQRNHGRYGMDHKFRIYIICVTDSVNERNEPNENIYTHSSHRVVVLYAIRNQRLRRTTKRCCGLHVIGLEKLEKTRNGFSTSCVALTLYICHTANPANIKIHFVYLKCLEYINLTRYSIIHVLAQKQTLPI